jgi:hypothetical protein
MRATPLLRIALPRADFSFPHGSAIVSRASSPSRRRPVAEAHAFATAAAEPVTAAPKRQKRREEPSLDAMPDECLFEVLRRMQGARELLTGIRASEAVLAPAALAVPDLNQEYLSEDDEAMLARGPSRARRPRTRASRRRPSPTAWL